MDSISSFQPNILIRDEPQYQIHKALIRIKHFWLVWSGFSCCEALFARNITEEEYKCFFSNYSKKIQSIHEFIH